MDVEYDEDLAINPFFCRLKADHQILLETAPLEGWIVTVPRAGCVQVELLSNPDYLLSHILIPSDELPDIHFINLIGTDVRMLDRMLIREYPDAKKQHCAHILFEEIFYTNDLHKFKIWCISSSLYGNDIASAPTVNLRELNSFRDVQDMLWQETNSKPLLRRIDRACNTFMRTKRDDCFALSPLKEHTQSLLTHCIDSVLISRRVKEKCHRDGHFFANIRLAVESYMMSVIYEFVFNGITLASLEECAAFNRSLRNLDAVGLPCVDASFNDALRTLTFELSTIETYCTILDKMKCFHRALNAITRANGTRLASMDELIPILVVALCKTGLTHWPSTLILLKEFNFTGESIKNGASSFLVATLEAAIFFIKSSTEKSVVLETTGSDGLNFDSTENFLAYLFKIVRSGSEAEIIKLLNPDDRNANPQNNSTFPYNQMFKRRGSNTMTTTNTVGLCHPLCVCPDCATKMANSRPHINSTDADGLTAIHVAAMHGLPKILNLLLVLGSKVNVCTAKLDWTPLHFAAARGHQNTLLLLLHAGAEINALASDGSTPLHLAAGRGHDGCAKALLFFAEQHVVRVNATALDCNGDTPLHLAARWGFIDIVDALTEHGVKIDVLNCGGRSPVDDAHNSRVRSLLNNSFVLVNAIPAVPANENGHTNDSLKIITAILNADLKLAYFYLGIDENSDLQLDNQLESDCHPLCSCPTKCMPANCGGINKANENGWTALHACAAQGYIGLAKCLIKMGAMPNLRTQAGQTPLHLACEHGHVQVIEAIMNVAQCELIDAQDRLGDTALHLAARHGHKAIVEALLVHEPNVRCRNNEDKTAADIARNAMYFSIDQTLTNMENEKPTNN